MTSLGIDHHVSAEFAPETTFLNTAVRGLLPRRAAEAVQALTAELVSGGRSGSGDFATVDRARASFARLVGVDPSRVATGGSVAVHVGLIAASLPAGAEVLFPEGDFSSLINPFVLRGDLKPRFAPLDELADAIRPKTALVAFSTVQSADGRTADCAAIREAAAAHGARTLADTTQSAGWQPLDAGAYDYSVTGAFKWLLCPRGTSFLTVGEAAQESLAPLHGGWLAAADAWNSTYGPIGEVVADARRFDEPPAFLAHHGAAAALSLIEEIGVDAIHRHDLALAARYRAGLAGLGHAPVPGASPIVSVPGLADREPELARAGVVVAARAGHLRATFHLYNTEADVDRLLDVLAG
ncbi:aminotransferase class V-fold PLP-dependent enzyme [Streptomyces alfalfae]|uniref:Class V aminotransferase n=1 Tax=Streptomyces alfalfae TaxID=1642299 RepID=A0ABN4VR17_9ACTN|nr:aminotransferase class V-fold PLP-dependent enzyme [Streptomyces alfalfae]AYA19376.1 aminotransferase class V-fold PLP-dependent enzyme [Streptomyces fradiae]APY88958.1 class V aminotransferase [Streptomyces alfalfae]QUI31098.1 aminotransferase class V-fold PLP-dependent enzyme [Streptomyces alfalfae]RXX35643.1 aminotransferase class V-fold PLP-dependent enzyme [Streptomyces alfalfae]RZM81568.1 aminotransferase class V-fold PLP-dependent enzyme [Streptomyces alfalfae]